jgi:hypothetical protein
LARLNGLNAAMHDARIDNLPNAVQLGRPVTLARGGKSHSSLRLIPGIIHRNGIDPQKVARVSLQQTAATRDFNPPHVR